MIPINLVFQMSDFRYEIKRNFITLYLTWNIDWKSGSRTTDPGSRLVDPVDDEDVEEIFHELILQLWQCAI
jgi:hypothetical protein